MSLAGTATCLNRSTAPYTEIRQGMVGGFSTAPFIFINTKMSGDVPEYLPRCFFGL
jgi:hypothetical protein